MIILKSPLPVQDKKIYTDLRVLERERFGVNLPFKCHSYKMPDLPAWANRIHEYNGYKINLSECSCTCEEYFRKVPFYPERDIRAVCRHLYFRLKYTAVSRYIDKLTLLLLDNQFNYGEDHLYKFSLEGKDFYFGFKKRTSWVNIYAEQNHWIRFSYNPDEGRWAYNSVPDGAEGIIQKLKELFEK
jgi:hypothetical protein